MFLFKKKGIYLKKKVFVLSLFLILKGGTPRVLIKLKLARIPLKNNNIPKLKSKFFLLLLNLFWFVNQIESTRIFPFFNKLLKLKYI